MVIDFCGPEEYQSQKEPASERSLPAAVAVGKIIANNQTMRTPVVISWSLFIDLAHKTKW